MNYFMEIAKLRAARMIWAKLMKPFKPKDARSLSLRTHCQTSGWSLAAQDVFNNVSRTMIEAMAATQGQTQSLHTNALDEALALPTDFSARIARNTQIVLQQEAGATRIVDPWGGSYYVERLTYELARKAWAHIEEVEELGGMTKAIEAGIPKLRIEEAAAKTQARIDAGVQSVIGVNKYQPTDEAPIEVLKVDNSAVMHDAARQAQAPEGRARSGSAQGSARRADAAAPPATAICSTLAVDAARAKATVGEISMALEKVFGRHRRRDQIHHRGLQAGGRQDRRRRTRAQGRRSLRGRGRTPPSPARRQDRPGRPRPRAESDCVGLCRSRLRRRYRTAVCDAVEAARQAVENGVHILGVSSLAAAHLTLVPQLKAELAKQGRDDIMIVVGGVVPSQDYDALKKAGAEAIFPPGTVIAEAAENLLKTLHHRLGHDQRAAE